VRDGKADRYKTKALLIVAGIRENRHKGIRSAVEKAFIGASWQMCHVHFVRDVLRRVNKELKRRTFPNERSLIRLAVAILIDINEEWLTGRRYLDNDQNRAQNHQPSFSPFYLSSNKIIVFPVRELRPCQ